MSPRALWKRALAAWILRRQGHDRLPVLLHRRRLYVLPTRAGVVFGFVLLAMLIAGLNYGNSLALFLTFWLAGLALVAMHQCHRNLLALGVRDAALAPAFAGEHSLLTVILANEAPLARYRVSLDVDAVRAARSAIIDLPPQGPGRLSLALPAPRRGVFRLARLRISTTHPFGLFRAWTWVHAPLSAIVYPSAQGPRLVPPAVATRDAGTARGGEEEQEWLGLRAFRAGDSPRQIAWKAVARGGPLLTKEYAATGAAVRRFELAGLEPLPLEARLSQLARWVVDAEARGERYALRLPGVELAPGNGPLHRHRALSALAGHGQADATELA